MKLQRHFLVFLFVFFSCFAHFKSYAQQEVMADTVQSINTDSLRKKIFRPDAKRAGLYSALIPGLGQAYNRQYWKVPIVYALLGTTTYLAISRNNEYLRYRKAYISRLSYGTSSTNEFQGLLNTVAIKTYQDAAKQNRDMMILLTVVGYAGQVLEAISGAHLRGFDISKDISMKALPTISPNGTVGFGLAFNFKK